MNSRQKGKRGELEFAGFLREQGWGGARRGQQHRGGPGSPDVLQDQLSKLVHFEVKYGASLRLYPSLAQAERDRAPGQSAVVAYRQVKKGTGPGQAKDWIAVLKMEDLLEVYRMLLIETRTGE